MSLGESRSTFGIGWFREMYGNESRSIFGVVRLWETMWWYRIRHN
jgi:hypothetical protein